MDHQSTGLLPQSFPVDRPRLLAFVPALLLLWALLDLLWLVVTWPAAGEGALSTFGSPLGVTEYRRHMVPMQLLSIALLIALAAGLWKECSWARPLAVWLPLSWLILPAIFLPSRVPRGAILAELAVPTLIASVIVLWYFYRKESVREYYAWLATRRAEG